MASKDCERLRPLLVDYVVGEMVGPEGQNAEIERHLAECAECRAAAEELRGTGRALEAVKVFDTQLREEVRKNITSRARVEAQLVRATREHQRIAAESAARAVPVAAWVVLALGAAGALALAAALPRMGLFTPRPGGRVVSCLGEALSADWPSGRELQPGERIPVPEECLMCLQLGDGTRLELAGPAEVRLAHAEGSLKLGAGRAYLETQERVAVEVEALKSLGLEGGSKVCFAVTPAETIILQVTVMAGSADYAAGAETGRLTPGKTLRVDAGTRAASVRDIQESDRPHWRKKLEVLR
jgi:hypothetical protein